jgi:tetratricopeptide (TPR) repeat protein
MAHLIEIYRRLLRHSDVPDASLAPCVERLREVVTRHGLFRSCLFAGLFVLSGLSTGPWKALAQNAAPSTATVVRKIQAGQYEEAARICKQLLQASPRSPQLWTLRGAALERAGHTEHALDAYQQALRISPDYLAALQGAAQLGYKTRSKDAIPLLERIVKLQPANKTAYAMLGSLQYSQQNFSKAVEGFERSGDLAKSQPASLMEYSLALIRLHRESEAIPLLEQVLVLDASNSIARYDLGLTQWRAGDATNALKTLEPLLRTQPLDSRSMRLAAAIHESNNETPQAVDLLRSAIIANPDDVDNYVDFATLAFTHGSYSVGVDIVSAGISRRPDAGALFMARGVLYGQNGDFDKAMEDFDHAHKLDPTNSMAASAQGIALSQKHSNKEALDAFRRQVKEHPNDAFGYYLLAEALYWSGPEQKSLGYRKNIAEAITNAEKARELDPNLSQVYDLLSTLYLQNEQFQKTIEVSRLALKRKPNDQQVVYTLILALRKVGAKDELNVLVQRLTALRKQEQMENNQKQRYGMLVEQP